MDLSKNTIVGIHAGASKFDFNKGYFIKNPIIEFIQNKDKNINKINYDKNVKSNKNIINNEKFTNGFIKVIHLAIYYKFINYKINQSKNIYYELSSNDYKLVSSKWMTDIKIKFNFHKINEELESNDYFRNSIQKYNNINNYKLIDEKNIYSIIQAISPNKSKEFNEYNYNKNIEKEILPSITKVEYKDYSMNNQEIYIYNEFELISNDIINLFKTGDNNNIGNNYSQCYIKDNFIFINFPYQENGNDKLITLLGKLNKNNSFKTENILIYDNYNEDERTRHIKGIYDVQNFLNNYGNVSEPFTDEKFKILGTIVKYKSTNNNNEDYNYNINNKNIDAYQ